MKGPILVRKDREELRSHVSLFGHYLISLLQDIRSAKLNPSTIWYSIYNNDNNELCVDVKLSCRDMSHVINSHIKVSDSGKFIIEPLALSGVYVSNYVMVSICNLVESIKDFYGDDIQRFIAIYDRSYQTVYFGSTLLPQGNNTYKELSDYTTNLKDIRSCESIEDLEITLSFLLDEGAYLNIVGKDKPLITVREDYKEDIEHLLGGTEYFKNLRYVPVRELNYG